MQWGSGQPLIHCQDVRSGCLGSDGCRQAAAPGWVALLPGVSPQPVRCSEQLGLHHGFFIHDLGLGVTSGPAPIWFVGTSDLHSDAGSWAHGWQWDTKSPFGTSTAGFVTQGLKERTGSGPACPHPDLDWALPSASSLSGLALGRDREEHQEVGGHGHELREGWGLPLGCCGLRSG